MEEKYKKWDNFINQLMIGVTTAQNRCDYFLFEDLDPNEPYDLLFVRVSLLANNFTKCNVKCAPYPNPFKFIRFKLKEKNLKLCFHARTRWFVTRRVHTCTKNERVELIELLAEKCDIHPEEIEQIYKEYYNK